MTIDSSTGLIQWTPASAGDFPVTVKVSNAVNPDALQSFSIHVIDLGGVPAGLISYWKLDETVSGTYIDQMGINNGTGNLSPTPSAGQVSGAQLFDGSTTKIDVPADTSLDFTAAGNFSVEFWYKGSTSIPSALNVAVSRVISGSAYWWVGIAGGTGKAYFSMYIVRNCCKRFGNVITDGIMASCCCY